MSIITRMFHWEGEYHKSIGTLPVSGLKALLNELKQMRAMQGYTFKDGELLEDVERTIYHRTGKR